MVPWLSTALAQVAGESRVLQAILGLTEVIKGGTEDLVDTTENIEEDLLFKKKFYEFGPVNIANVTIAVLFLSCQLPSELDCAFTVESVQLLDNGTSVQVDTMVVDIVKTDYESKDIFTPTNLLVDAGIGEIGAFRLVGMNFTQPFNGTIQFTGEKPQGGNLTLLLVQPVGAINMTQIGIGQILGGIQDLSLVLPQEDLSFGFICKDGEGNVLNFLLCFSLLGALLSDLCDLYDVSPEDCESFLFEGWFSGCLIATAAFGSELAPEVQFLRAFRDERIMSTLAGSSFINVFNAWYYSFSPYVADFEREQPWLQQLVKAYIYPLIGILQISEKGYSLSGGEYGTLIALALQSSMIGAVYAWPLVLPVKHARRSKFNYKLALSIIAAASLAVVVSVITANELALMITTPFFVLAVLWPSAILSCKLITALITRLRQANAISTDVNR
jgi:hypothetical protein